MSSLMLAAALPAALGYSLHAPAPSRTPAVTMKLADDGILGVGVIGAGRIGLVHVSFGAQRSNTWPEPFARAESGPAVRAGMS